MNSKHPIDLLINHLIIITQGRTEQVVIIAQAGIPLFD